MSILLTPSLKKNLDKLSPHSTGNDVVLRICDLLRHNQDECHKLTAHLQNNIKTLTLQKQRCSDIIAILEELGGLTVRARNFVTTPQDAEKYKDRTKDTENLFKSTLTKLDKTVSLSHDNGLNLCAGESLKTIFDTRDENHLLTSGISLDSTNLGIRAPNFSTMLAVQNSRIDVMNALDMAVTLRNIISSDIETLTIAHDFTLEAISNATSAEKLLGNSNTPDEAAGLRKLTAQKTLCDEPLADEKQQEILENFAATPNMEEI
jgi:hypothetical protein